MYQWMGGTTEGMFAGVIFRAAMAIMFSFVFVLLTGNRVIRWLLKQKLGDRTEFHNATLNELTKHKGNTPTMGGILIIGAILLSSLLFADIKNFYVDMAMFCIIYLGVLGGVDDWLKLTTARRNPGSREGLYAWEKMVFQVGLGLLLALFIYYHPDRLSATQRRWPQATRTPGRCNPIRWYCRSWKEEMSAPHPRTN